MTDLTPPSLDFQWGFIGGGYQGANKCITINLWKRQPNFQKPLVFLATWESALLKKSKAKKLFFLLRSFALHFFQYCFSLFAFTSFFCVANALSCLIAQFKQMMNAKTLSTFPAPSERLFPQFSTAMAFFFKKKLINMISLVSMIFNKA